MEGGLGEMVGMGEMGMVGEMGMPMPGAPLDGVGQQLPLPEGARSTGQVRRWTNDRGFGFIAPDDGDEDLFCHFSNIVGGNALIQDGQVEFVKVYDDRKGKERAEQVTGSGVTTNEGGGGGMGGLKWRPHSTWSSQSLLRYRAACSLYAVCPAPEWK